MIKPITTKYNGYKFRSRLEARWAVFFDALKVPYEFETEGFDLGKKKWYLPDFLIKPPYGTWNFWVEIKPMLSRLYVGQKWYEVNDPKVDMEAFAKISTLVESGQRFRNCKYGMVIFGEPGEKRHQVLLSTDTDSFGSPEDTVSVLGICHWCGSLLVGYGEYWLPISTTFYSTRNEFQSCFCEYVDSSSPIILDAFQKALEARFEFGETPKL
jgi:hypothetical protein